MIAIAALAACGDDPTTTLKCGTGTKARLVEGQPVAVVAEAGADLRGAAVAAGVGTTVPADPVSIECAADIVPDGYVALGPAVSFGAEGTVSGRPFELTLPYKSARLPKDGTRRHVRIVAKRAGEDAAFFPLVSNR